MDLDALAYTYAEEHYEDYLETLTEDVRSTSDDFQLPSTVSATELRLFNTSCPVCLRDFAANQSIAKYQCGHSICI